jgi:hypothetical protein
MEKVIEAQFVWVAKNLDFRFDAPSVASMHLSARDAEKMLAVFFLRQRASLRHESGSAHVH